MKRSRVPRLALDRLALASVAALPRASAGTSPRSARALSGLALGVGTLIRAIAARRRLRISLLILLVATPLAFGGWRLLRTSSLVSVDRVQLTGIRGPEAKQIERALVRAAKRMTTLDVSRRALLAAVAPFHLVRSLSVSTSFPHGMRIRVLEQLPAAILNVAGARTAVAADGAVLGPRLVAAGLPTVNGAYEPPAGGVVHDAALRGELEVLGAAPRALTRYVSRAFEGPRGLTVAMTNGLQAYFGDSSRPHAKWLALVLVLSDNSSSHVSAVDVRAPERPAAEFAAGFAPTSTTAAGEGGTSATGGSTESIAAALAAGLAESAGYSSSAEAQSANAAKAAETLSPSRSTTTSESGTAPPASGSEGEAEKASGGESASSISRSG